MVKQQFLQDLKKLAEEQKKDIGEIKTTLSQQLRGISLDEDEDSSATGLAEKTTLRELLEGTLFKLDSLTSAWENNIPGPANLNVGQPNPFNSLSVGNDIRASTDSAEQKILLEEFQDLNGVDVEKPELDRFLNEGVKTTNSYFILSIENNLDTDLNQFDYHLQETAVLKSKNEVRSGAASHLAVTDPGHNKSLLGTVSYNIVGEFTRLVIGFNQGERCLRVAFIPECSPMAGKIFPFHECHDDTWDSMTNKRWIRWTTTVHNNPSSDFSDEDEIIETDNIEGGPRIFVVRYHGILARICVDDNRRASLVLTRMAKNSFTMDSTNERPASKSVLHDGKSLWGKDVPNLVLYSLKNYGYVLEISNYLNVCLNDPRVYLEKGDFVKVVNQPKLVVALGREAFIAETIFCGKGTGVLLTFQIDSTDLRLAVAFRLFNGGNKFAVGFILNSRPTDGALMKFLTNKNNWNTCMDHKYAGAKDGEQVIETRNIQACASMTDGPKAAVKLAVKAY